MALLPRAAAAAAEDGDEVGPRGATAPDERMYCSVINAMGECGAWEAAVELVQSMRRSSSSLEPPQGQSLAAGGDTADSAAGAATATDAGEAPQPGRSAYACACRACARQGEWGAVLALIEDMRQDGVARDASVYASAMRAFVEAGEWERAVEIATVQVREKVGDFMFWRGRGSWKGRRGSRRGFPRGPDCVEVVSLDSWSIGRFSFLSNV